MGQALAPDHMLGRLFSPMVDVRASRDFKPGASTDWDVLPEMQITVSRRQHVRLGFGYRSPFTNTDGLNTAGSVLFSVGPRGREDLGRLAMKLGWSWAGVLWFDRGGKFPRWAVRGKAQVQRARVPHRDQDRNRGREREG